jgi:hypothetical protein
MNKVRYLSLGTYHQGVEFQRIGSRAVRKAQEDSRQKKVPNVYSHNGTLLYESADGQ